MKTIDFLPERIHIQRARRRRLTRQGYMLLLCVLALAALGYLRYGRVREARAELDLLAERATNLQSQIATRATLEAQQAELLVKQRIDEHLGTRVNVLDILGELQRVTSERLTLTSLSLEALEIRVPIERMNSGSRTARPAVAGAQEEVQVKRRIHLVLTGLAPMDIDVANFIGQLAASPLFEDVNMGYSRAIVHQNHEAREFQASCFIAR